MAAQAQLTQLASPYARGYSAGSAGTPPEILPHYNEEQRRAYLRGHAAGRTVAAPAPSYSHTGFELGVI